MRHGVQPTRWLDPLAIEVLGGLLAELAGQDMTVLFSSHQLDLVEHLCQDVVVVHHGRVVLAGALEELRAAARRRVIDLAIGDRTGSAPGWTPRMAGVAVAERGPGHLRLWADPSVDPAPGARPGAHPRPRDPAGLAAAESVRAVQGGGPMTLRAAAHSIRTIRLVAARELGTRLRSRAFQVATALMLLAVVAAIVLPAMLRPDTQATRRIGPYRHGPRGAAGGADCAGGRHRQPRRAAHPSAAGRG